MCIENKILDKEPGVIYLDKITTILVSYFHEKKPRLGALENVILKCRNWSVLPPEQFKMVHGGHLECGEFQCFR